MGMELLEGQLFFFFLSLLDYLTDRLNVKSFKNEGSSTSSFLHRNATPPNLSLSHRDRDLILDDCSCSGIKFQVQ